MIEGLYETHLPVRDLERSIQFYERLGLEFDHRVEDRLAFLWIEKDKSWLGLWETEKVDLEYHPSIRHIAFQVTLENLKKSVQWLKDRSMEPREAFDFEPTEPFVMAVGHHAHAKIHFNDPDGNSLELICKLPNPEKRIARMYLSDWEKQIEGERYVMPTIETNRLRMITFTVDMMKASLQGELEKAAGYKVTPGYPMDAYKEFFPYKIERFSNYPAENEYEGVIIHKGEQTIIGDMGFKGGPDEEGCMDLGYSMMKAYQGKGYTTEMAKAAVTWGLQQPGVKRITASCSENNIASIRVLEKVGFKRDRKEGGEIYWSIHDIS